MPARKPGRMPMREMPALHDTASIVRQNEKLRPAISAIIDYSFISSPFIVSFFRFFLLSLSLSFSISFIFFSRTNEEAAI